MTSTAATSPITLARLLYDRKSGTTLLSVSVQSLGYRIAVDSIATQRVRILPGNCRG